MSEDSDIPQKRARTEEYCLIHCSDDDGALVSPNSVESWETLKKAAEIRQHEGILDVEVTSPDEIPDGVFYHRKCRSIFTMKRDLEKIIAAERERNKHEEPREGMGERRASIRGNPSASRIYEKECIFCGKKDKYKRGSKSRESLTQARQFRTDVTVRNAAEIKNDTKVLAILSRELVAAEAHYHRTCYRQYININNPTTEPAEGEETVDLAYANAERNALSQLFDYIRNELFVNKSIVELSKLNEMLKGFIRDGGIEEIKLSTIKHLRRKLENEFKDTLRMILLTESNKVILYPDNLTRDELAVLCFKLQREVTLLKAHHPRVTGIKEVATQIRQSIREHCVDQEWPPNIASLDEDCSDVPPVVHTFLHRLFSGSDSPLMERMTWLKNSVAQDMVFAVTRGRFKPAKHILLPSAVKSLTGNVELIQLLNRLGHGIAYSQLEELNTSLCLQKISMAEQGGFPLPGNIHAHTNTVLAFDNIDRLEGTLSGGGTSHRVNGIAIQHAVCGPHLEIVMPKVDKSKERTFAASEAPLPIYNVGQRTGPAPRKVVEVDRESIMKEARKRNLMFLLTRLHYAQYQQIISSWTGFNIQVHDREAIIQSNVGYLPTINAPATSMSTINEVLNQSLTIMRSLKLTSITCVFDQAIYCKALEIKSKNADLYKPIVLRLGTFHTLCTLLSIIGKRFQDAGLKDLCIESGVVAEGSVSALMEGRGYNRAVRFHKLSYEAFMRVAWAGFLPWIESHHPQDADQIEKALEDIGSLADDLQKASHDQVMHSQPFKLLFERSEEYLKHLRRTNGPLSAFWMSYIDIIELMLHMIRASREGDWMLHLACVRQMLPWCFAYDNINYARYMSVYYSDMTSLPDEHPQVHAFMEAGGFSVQMSSDNPFGRIPVDQTIEETINKDTQTAGGTKGFSLKPGALQRYYMTAEFRTLFLRKIREMVGYAKGNNDHADLQKSRITKDENDVQGMVDIILNWINPFADADQPLASISTSAVASPEIAQDLDRAYLVGEAAYQDFKKERLEPDKPSVKFHDPLKKQKLKSFTNLSKTKKVAKSKGNEIVLRADRNLFARMIIIAESRQLHMQDVLQHPLGPLPSSLASSNGLPRKTNKAQLGRELEKLVQPMEQIPSPTVYLIDGMALIQKLKVDQFTFGEIADTALARVLREGGSSTRIDVVFDVYRELSIKSVEREQRREGDSITYKNLAAGQKIKQFRNFLQNGHNKNSLIKFIVDHWSRPSSRAKLQDKNLYATCGNLCYKLTTQSVQEVEELRSEQEEADTRLLLHAKHASKPPVKAIVVSSEDTDVRILCVAFTNSITVPLYQRCVSQHHARYIDIGKIANAIGEDVCKALLGLHAFTGCDSVSAFAGIGKVKPLKLLRNKEEFQGMLQNIGEEWSVSEELCIQLESFVSALYGAKKGTKDINLCRYAVFCAKKGEAESHQLPPCRDCLRKHCQRANYQAAVWKNSLLNNEIPSPVGKGWVLERDESCQWLEIEWMSGLPAPRAVIELMACTCKRSCESNTCDCILNGLKCSDLCRLATCSNQPDEDEDFSLEEDEDDDHDLTPDLE